MTTAFSPVDVGGIALANRIVMSPMTRGRAYGAGATPTSSMATYYAQRASAGLIITEGTQPSVIGQGYIDTPGLHSAEQVAAWRNVTAGVRARGGVIFAQLMHAGRLGHRSLLPDGSRPVGPSAVKPAGQVLTHEGLKDYETPLELSEEDIQATIDDFVGAAHNALEAGFHGVELHGANGYLIHQFLSTNANLRSDGWGGSVERRVRFAVEVSKAVAAAIGPSRVGLRISPAIGLGDLEEDGYRDTYRKLVDLLNPIGLAYLHLTEAADRELTSDLRQRFGGTFILNPATPHRPTGPEELGLVEDGTADLIAFGRLFLANPDLPERLAQGGPYNAPDRNTFYGGNDQGYTDYPYLDTAIATS